jgi:hypothetical protein
LTEAVKREVAAAIRAGDCDGYYLRFRIVFLGRVLRFGDTELKKLALFRVGAGRFEKRLRRQDASMQDIEVHEHVVVDGRVGRLTSPVRHENTNRLDRYIDKHNAYSNWEARVQLEGNADELPPRLFGGTQAQRRRWLKRTFLRWPGSPILFFLYKYIFKFGLFDGRPGLIYCGFQAIQFFHIKAKVYEARVAERAGSTPAERAGDNLAKSVC